MTRAATDERPVLGEAERLRAEFYGLLATLLSAPADQDLLDKLSALTGDESALGQGIEQLARLAASVPVAEADREYNKLFIGLGRGEFLPYGSYYLTGFLNEKPLAQLRDHMAALGLARDPDVKEPEDHIASLCETMAALILGTHGAPLSLEDQHAFFNTHIAPWAGHFFSDLEAAKGAVLYAPVGTLGRVFMEIEFEAFRLEG
ncbi:MAG: molecular chaperone TorD family protein [Pseudomonadota bacterium]